MVIRSSSSRDIERLILELRSDDAAREAAIARLRVIGSRAVERLSALVRSAEAPAVRAAALKALEGQNDSRALKAAAAATDDRDSDVASAAVGVLRGWLAGEHGTKVLDRLSAMALDPRRLPTVRLAALDALSELPRQLVQPVFQQAREVPTAPEETSRGEVPAADDPLTTRQWIASHPQTPLSTLHDLIARIRERERREPSGRTRKAWLITRGAGHSALAARGSRIALYDLRESFDATPEPLPLDFLRAISAIGDGSCLEPLARAWTAAPAEGWWRDRLRDAAAEITVREKLTRRHAVVKRVRARYEGFL